MIQVSAPGKMILLGEYAVLEGAPALVCAVNRRAYVGILPATGNEFTVHSPSLKTGWQPFILTPNLKVRFDPNLSPNILNKLHFFADIFESIMDGFRKYGALAAMGIELETDAFYSTELHRKLGFGSSSALTTALTKALSISSGFLLNENEIFLQALSAHRTAQGNMGSGIDIAASTFGGILEYKIEQIPQKVNPWEELPLAVVWTGASASTSKMVQSVSMLKQENPLLYKTLIKQLSLFSEEGITAYKERQLDAFLATIRKFYDALTKLGNKSNTSIISEPHQLLAELAARHDAAYKPSGAGGGDIGLLFASSIENLAILKREAVQKGFKIVDTDISPDGVTVHK